LAIDLGRRRLSREAELRRIEINLFQLIEPDSFAVLPTRKSRERRPELDLAALAVVG
jgi:hypothetical protein